MANREELLIIRRARAGHAADQLALGKRYLFGSAGLPKSMATALYWLDRAARQQQQEAWLLIGSHIPFETVQQAAHPPELWAWFERAIDAGVPHASLVLARLLLAQRDDVRDQQLQRKVAAALETAAGAGSAEAQWLLAQMIDAAQSARLPPAQAGDAIEWATRAAHGGVLQAQHALAEHAWATADHAAFLRWALPLARQIADQASAHGTSADAAPMPLRNEDVLLLSRCAQTLLQTGEFDAHQLEQLLELAAQAGERNAQFFLGLWYAKIDQNGKRLTAIPGLANYKKALRWLALAGEQGLADAWQLMSHIYSKAEFSQRNLSASHHYLKKAAEAGHSDAQLRLGITAWRTRRDGPSRDVHAVYWLQKAAAQGNAEAQTLLAKIATPATPAPWAQAAQRHLTRDLASAHPLLAARIELAAVFGLSRQEALLLDLNRVTPQHCLLVDIRERYPRSKRRLILVQTGDEYQMLNRVIRLFEDIDCGPNGPEGSYRQRLYRLKNLVPE